MIDRLRAVEDEFVSLEASLSDPDLGSDQARFWIDTRELEARDFVAAMLPQFRWEAYRDWEPMFRDEAVDEEEEDAPPPPPPAKAAPAKVAPKAELFEDDDIPF